jgi:hypothetical protein
MRRLAVFTLFALAPSYIVTQHGGGDRPPSSSVQPPLVTYVSAKRHVPTSPIPAWHMPDVSGSEGSV